MSGGKIHQLSDDLFAQPHSLIIRMNSDITDVGTIPPISQGAPGTNEPLIFINKAFVPTVREDLYRLFEKTSFRSSGDFSPSGAILYNSDN